MSDNEDKWFKVEKMELNNQLVWDVVRYKHATRGDYLMARFYDRGSAKLFMEALESKGFKQIKN